MSGRFLANENFPISIVQWLRDRGHDVVHAATHCPGAWDEQVLELARGEDGVLLTFDRDFGDLIFRLRSSALGVVLFRFDLRWRDLVHHLIREFFESQAPLEGYFMVVQAGHFRQAMLPR